MENIVVLDSKSLGNDMNFNSLKAFGNVNIYDNILPNKVEEAIKDATIILTNKVVLNRENLRNNTRVKLICVCATGTNNIDIDYAKEKGIVVTNVAGYSTDTVAQHTFSMLFYLYESLSYYDNYTKSGEYSKSPMFTHIDKPFNDISGKIYGIIGMGNIGRRVAAIASAFGCKVIYYSTSGKNNDSIYERVSFERLLKDSDIISIHCPLTDQTNKLIGYEQMNMMKSTAYLLNLGRGNIVVEEDLARALNENIIKGAALDVLSKEPIDIKNPLLRINDKNKLIITPHIAWASVEARERLMNEVIENIKSFLRGESRNRIC